MIAKVSYLTFAHVLSGVFVLASTTMLANKLGPRLYGEFSFMDSVLFVAVLVGSLGTEYIGNREVARREHGGEFVDGIIILRTIASLAIYLVLIAWTTFFIRSASLKALMYVCASIMLTVPGINGWYFLARQEIGIVAGATVLRDLLFFLFVSVFLNGVAEQENKLFYAGVFYSLSRFAFSAVLLLRMLGVHDFRLRISAATCRLIMKDSFALLYASLVAAIMINIQIYILKYYDEVYSLGIYGAFFKPIFYIQMLSLSFVIVFFPLLAKAWDEDRERYGLLARSLSEMTIFIIVPVAVTGLMNADYLIGRFFSPEFGNGTLTLQILCLALVPMGFGRVLTTAFLVTANKTHRMYALVNISFIFSLVSGVLFVKNFAQTDLGAALSKLLTEVVFMAIAYYMLPRRLKILDYRMLYCIVPAITGMVLVDLTFSSKGHPAGIIAGLLSFALIYAYVFYKWRYESVKEIISRRI